MSAIPFLLNANLRGSPYSKTDFIRINRTASVTVKQVVSGNNKPGSQITQAVK